MSTSNAMRFALPLGLMSVITVLALGASQVEARSIEGRSSSASRNARDCGGAAATDLEPCSGTATQSASTTSKASAAPAAAPPAASEDAELTAAGARGPAGGRVPSVTRGKSTVKPGGNRVLRRSGDGRVVPPTPIEEPRRGGVGTLIGITLA